MPKKEKNALVEKLIAKVVKMNEKQTKIQNKYFKAGLSREEIEKIFAENLNFAVLVTS